MVMKEKWKIIALMALGICLFSCFDADLIDPDKIDKDNIIWKPDMITPIMNVNVTLGDVLTGAIKDQTVVEEGGRYVIKYDEKDITSIKLKNLLNFPISTAPVFASKIPLPKEILALNGFDARRAGIKGDELEIGKTSAILLINTGNTSELKLESLLANFILNLKISPLGFKYKIELALGNPDSKVYKEQIVEKGGTLQPIRFDKNDELTFDKNNRNELAVDMKLSLVIDDYQVHIRSLSPISISFTLGNFTVEKAKGDFGNMKVRIPSGHFEVDMGDFNDVTGFIFKDPYIQLLIENHNMGIGMNLDFNFIAQKEGMDDISLRNENTPEFNLYGPDKVQDPGAFKPSVIVFDEGNPKKPNTNIVPFMNSFPFKEIAYNGNIVLIPHKNAAGENISGFVCADGEMKLSARIVMPMEFATVDEGLTYTQHLKNQSLGVDEKIKDRIKFAKFIFKAKNAWPIGVEFRDIVFKDKNNIELAHLGSKKEPLILLTAPAVNSDGTVKPFEDGDNYIINEIVLSEHVISILDKVKNIDLVMNLKVGGTGSKPAKFTSSERLDIIMGIQAKLDLSNPSSITK
jgi:hypothetical protein